ncbi:MAG: hypothetical protein NC321_12745 [Clostridium sp.]|nr:hypothetical protein [Clostridium sp.]
MEEYTLYLDESKNRDKTLFIISGIVVKNSEINKLGVAINDAKKCIWDENYINDNHPVLHCVELSTIKDSRNNKRFLSTYFSLHTNYSVLERKDSTEIKQIYDSIYDICCKAIKNVKGITVGCVINIEKFKYIYGKDIYPGDDLLFEVAMQEIIENYAHFLYINKSVGNIVYESRNDDFALTEKSPDFKMYNNFCKIKACNKGVSFINQEIIAKTIRYLYMYGKYEDIAGLQFADFIAYNILQSVNRTKNQYTEFMKKISEHLYNGGHDLSDRDLRDYFGLKKLPYDFQRIHNLEDENATIRKANDNIKIERNSLIKKNNLLAEGKSKLIKQNEFLKDEVKRLKTELMNVKTNVDNSI